MSNFSTFFPAGGGGEGAGINSYAPYAVTAAGNPVGYDPSTGLYTNPVDDSIWLKTGNTLPITSPRTYANATQVPIAPAATGTTWASPSSATGITWDGTHFWVAQTNQTISQYTAAGVATGTSWTATSATSINCIYFYSNTFYVSVPNGNIYSYNSSGGSETLVFSASAQSNSIRQVVFDGTNFYLYSHNTATILKYDSSGTYTNFSFPISRNVSYSFSMTLVDGNLWILEDYYADVIVYDLNGNLAGFGYTNPWGNKTSIYGITYANTGSGNKFYLVSLNASTVYEYNDYIGYVGDPTAKTDTSGSAQPLFIKLK